MHSVYASLRALNSIIYCVKYLHRYVNILTIAIKTLTKHIRTYIGIYVFNYYYSYVSIISVLNITLLYGNLCSDA